MNGNDTKPNNIDIKDAQEFLEIIGKLEPWQKQIALATLRGAVLMSDCEKKGA